MMIRRAGILGLLIVGLVAPRLPAQAHVGATGRCKDGTYTTVKTKSDACDQHGGVAEWMGTPAPAAPAAQPATTAIPTATKPATAPAGATGKCKDGRYTTVRTRSDACSKHGGVAEWMGAPAQPAAAPAGATGKCKDGTYTTVRTRSSACSKHGGVAKWMGAPAATAEPAPGATPGASAMTNPAPAPPEHPEPPAGATAQCKDGTYSTSKHVADTCSKHGGVGKWIHKPAS